MIDHSAYQEIKEFNNRIINFLVSLILKKYHKPWESSNIDTDIDKFYAVNNEANNILS